MDSGEESVESLESTKSNDNENEKNERRAENLCCLRRLHEGDGSNSNVSSRKLI